MDATLTGRVFSRAAITEVDETSELRTLMEQGDVAHCLTAICHGNMSSHEGRRRSELDYEGAMLND